MSDFQTLYYLSSRQYDIKFLVKVWLLGPHLFFLTLLLGQTSRPQLLYYFSRASSFHIYSTQGLLLGHFLKREIFTRRKNFRNSKLNQPIFFNEQLLNSLKNGQKRNSEIRILLILGTKIQIFFKDFCGFEFSRQN